MEECVSSALASILVNSSPKEEFKLERGLRQDDPLSPFLYLLIAEGLRILNSKASKMGLYDATKIGREKVNFFYLKYADDIIFMVAACEKNVIPMMRILRNFELLSGLKVNYNKCIVVGVNMERERLETVTHSIRCAIEDIPFLYLGVRVGICQKKTSK